MEPGPQPEANTYYLKNAARILTEVEPFFKGMQKVAEEKYGQMFAASIAKYARRRFKYLLPNLPYIGGDENFLTKNLVLGAAMLCLHQEMQERKKDVEETGQILFETVLKITAAQNEAGPDSRQIEKMIGVHQHAERFSMCNPYSYGWETKFLEGDGKQFDWGVDYTSCGVCSLYRQYDAEAFIPYICFLDLPMYRARGIGLVRTQTLAQGGECCDFRFNLRGEYNLEWEPAFHQKGNKRH